AVIQSQGQPRPPLSRPSAPPPAVGQQLEPEQLRRNQSRGLLSWTSPGAWGPAYLRGPRPARATALAESARTRRKTMFFFSALDVNRDMYVSAEEFKPIAELLRVIKPLSGSEKAQEVVKEEKSSLQEKLTIVARFQPLLLDTMSNSKSGFREISDIILSGLKNWTNPALSSSVFSASQFKAFLPPRNDMELGEVWWIIPDTVLTTGVYLSDNRFYPPPPKGKEVIIHKLLSMFHTRPFVKTRFGPQGTVACLTAISGSYYTVAFRIHAEFQLNQPLHYPFWFCPSQFTGHIILSKNSSHVQDFKLFVPNERSLNVGLQWLHGPLLNPHVDLGYLPQMKLEASGPSMPSSIQDEKSNETDSCLSSKEAVQFKMEDIVWQQELSREEAAQQLERAMYDFKKVQYLPFTKAFDRARTEKKLVHSVILWGALDDQSCSGHTLRNIVLKNSSIITLLNEKFISTWSLFEDLEKILNEENEFYKKLAQLHLEKYEFPVESLVCLPNGTVVCGFFSLSSGQFLSIPSSDLGTKPCGAGRAIMPNSLLSLFSLPSFPSFLPSPSFPLLLPLPLSLPFFLFLPSSVSPVFPSLSPFLSLFHPYLSPFS
uniref:EF-hand domain-containing protein n=1 Tax=Sarcophilus harrisii TaxID=9305 RepID=A0A7N4NTT8_SARHA